MGALTVITAREASIFACVCDTVVAPGDALPPVSETDAAFAFDRLLAASPPLNRIGLRALFLGLELAPRCFAGARLRRLPAARRAAALERTGLMKVAAGIAHFLYYGDEQVMRRLGYDADAIVARAKEVRA